MPTSSHSSSSSSLSFPTQSMSPTSHRSSIASSINTPVTPLDLNAPHGPKDGRSQSSWFGAMQESYLANKNILDSQRPPLQRMGRMSVCAPPSAQQYGASQQQTGQAGSNFLGVSNEPPRRASVATFQPTSTRPSAGPQRPSIQPTNNSEPLLHSTSFGQQHTLLSPNARHRQTPHLSVEVPRIVSPQPMTANDANNEVERLYAEVFGNSLSSQSTPLASLYAQQPGSHTSPTIYSPSSQVTPKMPSTEHDNYNFSGVLLQPEDLHMLGSEPLSPTSMEMPLYAQQQAQTHQSTGWQTSFSLAVPQAAGPSGLQPALPINAQADQWSFANFHGFQHAAGSTHSTSMVERALSAPPPEEAMSAYMGDLDRRRGSSVDSVAMLPFASVPSVLEPVNRALLSPIRASPAYLGSGLSPYQQSSIAVRRSTVGPGSLVLQPVPRTAPPATPPHKTVGRNRTAPPASAPPTTNRPIVSPSPTPRRYAGRGGSRRGSGNAAPMFINFTSKDANKLLSGVAPSGSSKRKRDEEEARSSGKQTRSEGMRSPGGSPVVTAATEEYQ